MSKGVTPENEPGHSSSTEKYACEYERIFNSNSEDTGGSEMTATNDTNLTKRIQSSISDCTKDLLTISDTMATISKQGGWDAFWSQGKNINDIANHVAKLTTVQKRSLDLIVLMIGAAGTMKADYNIIVESIEQLSKEHGGSVEVLDYLVNIKKMVLDLQKRDAIIQDLVNNTQSIQADVLSVGSSASSALKLAQESANDSANLKIEFSTLFNELENANGEVHNTKNLLLEAQKKSTEDLAVFSATISTIQTRLSGHLKLFRYYSIISGAITLAAVCLSIWACLG